MVHLVPRLAVFGGILMPLGCGADASPDTVVQNYLNAVADNKAEAACDLVTAVDLVKVKGRWRIDTTLVAMKVLGLV